MNKRPGRIKLNPEEHGMDHIDACPNCKCTERNFMLRSEPLTLLSLFSGIGAPEAALKSLGVPFTLVKYCEIDKVASLAYSLIHNVDQSLNLGDVSKVDTSKLPKDIDLVTYGFPCVEFSPAGKQRGLFFDDGSLTRSGLFFEALRIIKDTQPKITIAENVPELLSSKFKASYDLILKSLSDAGYNTYSFTLNALHYGIPQDRNRVFIISVRKDIDDFSLFSWHEPSTRIPLAIKLEDLLESTVDHSFFIDTDLKSKKGQLSAYLLSHGLVQPFDVFQHSYSSNRLRAAKGDPSGQKAFNHNIVPTLTTRCDCLGVIVNYEGSLRARKFTPLETMKFMGFMGNEYATISGVVSRSQIYKQSGNSIVVPVFVEVLRHTLPILNLLPKLETSPLALSNFLF